MRLLFDRNDVRAILPGTLLPLGENGDYIVRYFKDQFNIDVEYLEETRTLPGNGQKGNRIDQIITVLEESVDEFDKIKDKLGAVYAKDVVRNGDHRLYKERTYLHYFQRLEKQLLKDGEISEDFVYQSKLS
ncbi:MAG TPA: hypothetical protein VK108_05515 [Pseudogracilibacillus sp.]|nr:hypothetical protein [Pseudogracilibacillus sp.]